MGKEVVGPELFCNFLSPPAPSKKVSCSEDFRRGSPSAGKFSWQPFASRSHPAGTEKAGARAL